MKEMFQWFEYILFFIYCLLILTISDWDYNLIKLERLLINLEQNGLEFNIYIYFFLVKQK